MFIENTDKELKNGDATIENEESSSGKSPTKRNNSGSKGILRSIEGNSSDDELKDTVDGKWGSAKRRRESSPYSIDEYKNSSNDVPDTKVPTGKYKLLLLLHYEPKHKLEFY